MSHVLSFTLITGNYVFDLRPQDINGSPMGPHWYRASQIQLLVLSPGAVTEVFPIAIDNASQAPSPVMVNGVGGVAILKSGNPGITIGQQYSKGWSPDVFKEPGFTHLLVTTSENPGTLQVIVD